MFHVVDKVSNINASDMNTRLIISGGIHFVSLLFFNLPDKCCLLKVPKDKYHAEVAFICPYLLLLIEREDEYHLPSQATRMA